MKRFSLWVMTFVLSVVICSAGADPLSLAEDLSNILIVLYNPDLPAEGSCTYSYRYPCISSDEPDASRINPFFADKITMLETNIEFLASGYANDGITVSIEETYRITCNNDQFFSVLITRTSSMGDQTGTTWQGLTFSRTEGVSDTSFDLPRMLGILDADELDEYQLTRQTEKAAEIVRELIVDQISDSDDSIPYYSPFTADDLIDVFYPEEDFYLNEDGDPVFYLEPGIAADESYGYLEFTIPIDLIEDEL